MTILLGALLQGSLPGAESLLSASGMAFPSVHAGTGARAFGLGSAYVGVAEGSSALFWNPAGLAGLSRAEIALHHTVALVGASQDSLVLGLPLGLSSGLALSLNYENQGEFDGRDTNGNPTGTYSAQGYGVNLGLGLGLPAGFKVGLGLKFNRQDLAGTAQNAMAGDLGLLWSLHPAFRLGIAYTNLGPDVGGRPLTQGLRVGASSYLGKGKAMQWLLAGSVEAMTGAGSSGQLGLEAMMMQTLALRAGYQRDFSGLEPTGLLGWSLGGGVVLGDLSLDYTYMPMEELGNTQKISLIYKFGPLRLKVVPKRPGRKLNKPAEALWKVKPTPTPAPATQAAVLVKAPTPIPRESYIVKKGDTLWSISGKEKVLGDSFRWSLLYDGNSDQIVDPDEIEVDQELMFKTKYTKVQTDAAEEKGRERDVFVPKK